MTSKEYMENLTQKLQFIEEETRNTLLEYYAEMLDDRMEDGMDEASAVAAMEAPEEIAARLAADPSVPKQAQKEETEKSAPPQGLDDDAMKFSSLVSSVLKTAQETLEGVPQLVHQSMEQAEKAVENAEQMVQDAQEAAEDGKWEDVVQKLRTTADAMEKHSMDGLARRLREAADSVQTQSTGIQNGDYEQIVLRCPADQLRAIRLTGGEMPIRVKPAAGADAALTYYTCDWDPYEAFVRDGIMILQRKEGGYRGKGRFSFSMLGGVIKMGWDKSSPTVELALPPDALVDLTVQTSNASIKANGLNALCDVDLKTSNSRIALEDISCKALEARSSNARIVLEHVAGKQFIHCTTSNGRIEAAKVKTGGDLLLTTSNGRIIAEKAEAKGEMRLGSSNSSIEVGHLSAAVLTLTTSNGGISGSLPGRQSDWAIQSRTSNGHNSLPQEQQGPKPLTVRTSNGSIHLRFEEE